jgi:alanyl-tRNA synthetase
MILKKIVDSKREGRIIEIWNNVFMEFNKTAEGAYEKLPKPNVDTGMGLERTAVVMQKKNNVFETDLFTTLITEDTKENRIIADHIKAAVFILSEGIEPGNTGSGYVLRRLIRRAVRYGADMNLAEKVIDLYKDAYPELLKNKEKILENLKIEEEKFKKTLERALGVLNKEIKAQILKPGEPYKIQETHLIQGQDGSQIFDSRPPFSMVNGKWLFDFYQSLGFPPELTIEELRKRNYVFSNSELEKINKEFQEELKNHQELSRTASAGMFKGGLAGTSEVEVKYHTTTHLLRQALEEILGEEIVQKGSNINPERLRFDFGFSRKLTDEEKQKVEALVNQKIREGLSVQKIVLSKEEAEKTGAVHTFGEKYGDEISIYFIGDTLETAWSKEFCGGPHVENTSEIGKFKITKEEASSAGVRRIKGIVN